MTSYLVLFLSQSFITFVYYSRLLHITFYLLVSRYSLPMTCHSLIATISLILVTFYQLLATFYQLLATLIADYLFKKSLHKPCENTGFYWPVFSRKKTES